MKRTKKLTINLLAISLATCLASSAMAGGTLRYFSEYLGREATPQEVAAVIAADREIQRKPVVISSTDSNELTYHSEYMGGHTTFSMEARTVDDNRETMAKTDDLTDSTGSNCLAKYFSEYEVKFKCL